MHGAMLLWTLGWVAGAPAEIAVEWRECAGVARDREPVVVEGRLLLDVWGRSVDTRCIRVADDAGRPVAVQVDERDGGVAFRARPNRQLDPDDEVVWQVSVPALGTSRYKVYLATSPAEAPGPAESDLHVGPNPQPAHYSAQWVMKNSFMEVGVRGWPVDKTKWSGCGAGTITMFRLFGHDEVYQGEGHAFTLNTTNFPDDVYNKLEIAASGPVRAILQLTGPEFSGRRSASYDHLFMDVTAGRAARAYMLYNGIPWLECHERVRGQRIHPRFVVGQRFLWRAGGTPFDPKTRLCMPRDDGAIASFVLGPEPYGLRLTHPEEAWVAALRPGDRGVPALFFEPKRTWQVQAWIVEPWMKAGFDKAGKYDHVKSIADVFLAEPDAGRMQEVAWRWSVWGTKTSEAREVQRQYRAWMMRPLRTTGRVGAVDRLALPADAVARLRKDLQQLQAELADVERFHARYRPAGGPTVDRLRARKEVECDRAAKLLEALDRHWNTLDHKARVDWLEKLRAWQTRPPDNLLVAQQFEWFREGGHGKGYRVLVTDNFHKVLRRERCPGTVAGPVRLEAARREGESVQLAVVPMLQVLSQVQVTAGDLTTADGQRLPATVWRAYRVADVKAPSEVNAAYDKPDDTRWPDPLLPLEPFDCPPDEARAVLLTVQVPAEAAPGQYRGTIRVAPKGLEPTEIAVTLQVYGFTLPERRTMFWDSWYDMDTVGRYYQYGPECDLAHFQRNMEMLAQYRAVPGLYGWVVLRRHVDIWREKDGRLTFDFGRLDPWLEAQQRYGNLWNPNLSCNSGWFSILHDEALGGIVRDRTTGRTLTLKDLPEKSRVNPKYTLIYEQFMKAYVAHLKAKGWLATAWLEKWDEPVGERIEPCKEHHAYLMKITSELRVFAWGLRPVTDAWATGYTHAWAPNLSAWYEEWPGAQKRRQAGEKLFAYTCGAWYASPDRTQMRPDINIWDPNAQRRVYAWLYEKLGLDGLLIFMMNGWEQANEKLGRDPARRWPQSEWIVPGRNTYWLVYPGPDGFLRPSLRLDALRDGLEDYEYLYAARQRLKQQPDDGLRQLLAIDASLVLDREIYAQEAAVYNARKAALARWLEKRTIETAEARR